MPSCTPASLQPARVRPVHVLMTLTVALLQVHCHCPTQAASLSSKLLPFLLRRSHHGVRRSHPLNHTSHPVLPRGPQPTGVLCNPVSSSVLEKTEISLQCFPVVSGSRPQRVQPHLTHTVLAALCRLNRLSPACQAWITALTLPPPLSCLL